jgi:ferrous iron transport protein A
LKTDFKKEPERTVSAPTPCACVPLSRLTPGSRAVIERVQVNSGIGRRLLDLGFIPETPIAVLRRAPLGDPVSYELRGYRICLRREEAEQILVRLQAAADPGDG